MVAMTRASRLAADRSALERMSVSLAETGNDLASRLGPALPGLGRQAGVLALRTALARPGRIGGLARFLTRLAPSTVAQWLPAPPLPSAAPGVVASAFGGASATRAGRRLNRAAGVLAASVLCDSAIEHYRGSFENRAMYAPLVSASLSLAASAHGVADQRVGAHVARDAVYLLAAAVGLTGTGFHIYNIRKRVGGFSWLNLFYGAPIGAPAALILSGLLGFTAERVRANAPSRTPKLLGLPAGRAVAAVTAGGLLGTVGEAGLLHFRGAYHDPFMYLPVTVPPVAAALLAHAALGPGHTNRWFTRLWLRFTALLGFAGVGFHIFGVGRNMGGWRNWKQNVLNGPPIPAPPSFTGLALAGLAALGLLEDNPHD